MSIKTTVLSKDDRQYIIIIYTYGTFHLVILTALEESIYMKVS
jgi:hypothetical protein